MKKFFLILALMLPFFWGCTSDDSADDVDDRIHMPIQLMVPMEGVPSPRAIGDPGSPENNQLPRYLYVYFVEKLGAGNFFVDHMVGEELLPENWVGNPVLGVYTYNAPLDLLLSNKGIDPSGSHVYAIASYDKIKGLTNPTTQEEVENLKLILSDQDLTFDLQNVYANPYNDPNNGKVVKHGDLLFSSTVTCYHIAARVDIQWDINPEKQKEYKLKTIELTKLPTEGYFFKHTENTEGTGSQTFTADVGNQWYGRHVFYVFDRKKVECSYTLDKGGTAQDPLVRTYDTPGAGNGANSNVFASWYRINATFGYPANP